MCTACKSNMRKPHSPKAGTEIGSGLMVGESHTFFLHERDLAIMLEHPYPHTDEGRLTEYGIITLIPTGDKG